MEQNNTPNKDNTTDMEQNNMEQNGTTGSSGPLPLKQGTYQGEFGFIPEEATAYCGG